MNPRQIVLVAAIALGLCACEVYSSRVTIPFETSADLDGVTLVRVTTRNGSVRVECMDGVESAAIKGEKFARGHDDDDARDWAERITITAERGVNEAHVLTIAATVPEGASSRSPGASFDLRLPRDLELRLETRNGSVEARGAQAPVSIRTSNGRVTVVDVDAQVVAKTSNGSIEARDIGGDLEADTSNGKIEIDGVRGALVRAETSNGKIEAVGVPAAATLRTSNGSIDLRCARMDGPPQIKAESSNGSVHVQVPPGVDATIDLRTSNGKVKLEGVVAEILDSGKRHLRARAGAGAGTISIESRNGTVSCEVAR